jgi:hypothetical protein
MDFLLRDVAMRTLERQLLTSLLLVLLMVGLKAATPDAGSSPSGLMVGTSSTNIQSFFWILDTAKREVTLCKTTSTASMGPQYDFDCKRRPIPPAD